MLRLAILAQTMPDDLLTQAVEAVDLPGLIYDLRPESGAKPGRAGVIKAVWRGDRVPSFSLFHRDGLWLWKDHATGEGGNAYDFLTKLLDYPKETAAKALQDRVGIQGHRGESRGRSRDGSDRQGGLQGTMNQGRLPRSANKPIPMDEVLEKLAEEGFVPGPSQAFSGRGFTKADTLAFDMYGDAEGNGALIVRNPDGEPVAVKVRWKDREPKYGHLISGHGQPAWCNPGFGEADSILIVEGELSAIAAYKCLRDAGYAIDVMGTGGAGGGPYWEPLESKAVWLYADDDDSGHKAIAKWKEVAKEAGAKECHVLPMLPGKDGKKVQDFCDLAAAGTLKDVLTEMFGDADRVFDAEQDRMIGFYSVKELLENHERFMRGEIRMPYGFPELDDYTGGLPESGLVMIGALSTIGKSVALRDILCNHLEQSPDHKVMLFTPDQAVPAVLRLLASRSSGIPSWRVRKGLFTPKMLDLFGGPEGVRKAYDTAHKEAVLVLSKRFMLSERQRLSYIQKEMEVAKDMGVTLFGGDFLQSFEMDLDKGRLMDEGLAVSVFRDWVREMKAAFLLAAQLAKSKFDKPRRTGIPQISDIEGRGKTGQLAETTIMIYNYDLYTSLGYAEDGIDNPMTEYLRTQYDGYHPLARWYVRKNREGPANDYMRLVWDREVPRFLPYDQADQAVSDPMPFHERMVTRD